MGAVLPAPPSYRPGYVIFLFRTTFMKALSLQRAFITVVIVAVAVAIAVMAQAPSDAPDLVMYGRIRDEGNTRSRVMVFAPVRRV